MTANATSMPRVNLWALAALQSKSSNSSMSTRRRLILLSSNGQDHLGAHSYTSTRSTSRKTPNHETIIPCSLYRLRRMRNIQRDCPHTLQDLVHFRLRLANHLRQITAHTRFATTSNTTQNRRLWKTPAFDQPSRRRCTMNDTMETTHLTSKRLLPRKKLCTLRCHCLIRACNMMACGKATSSSRIHVPCNRHLHISKASPRCHGPEELVQGTANNLGAMPAKRATALNLLVKHHIKERTTLVLVRTVEVSNNQGVSTSLRLRCGLQAAL
jgi:hypothetical protein